MKGFTYPPPKPRYPKGSEVEHAAKLKDVSIFQKFDIEQTILYFYQSAFELGRTNEKEACEFLVQHLKKDTLTRCIWGAAHGNHRDLVFTLLEKQEPSERNYISIARNAAEKGHEKLVFEILSKSERPVSESDYNEVAKTASEHNHGLLVFKLFQKIAPSKRDYAGTADLANRLHFWDLLSLINVMERGLETSPTYIDKLYTALVCFIGRTDFLPLFEELKRTHSGVDYSKAKNFTPAAQEQLQIQEEQHLRRILDTTEQIREKFLEENREWHRRALQQQQTQPPVDYRNASTSSNSTAVQPTIVPVAEPKPARTVKPQDIFPGEYQKYLQKQQTSTRVTQPTPAPVVTPAFNAKTSANETATLKRKLERLEQQVETQRSIINAQADEINELKVKKLRRVPEAS